MKRTLMTAALCVVAAYAAFAQTPPSPKPQLPGRVPMASHLLPCSPEWNAYYDVVPEGERRLYFTARTLLDATRQNIDRTKVLEARVEALEKQVRALTGPKVADPNQPQGDSK